MVPETQDPNSHLGVYPLPTAVLEELISFPDIIPQAQAKLLGIFLHETGIPQPPGPGWGCVKDGW